MNAIYRMRQGLLFFLLATLIAGCAVIQKEWADKAARSVLAPEDELATVVALYDSIERLRGLPGAARVQEYRDLDHNLTEQTPVRERLKLALFLSGLIEPELANYERARELLEESLAEAQGALLIGYIRLMLVVLDRNERQHNELEDLKRQRAADRRESQAWQEKTKTLEEQIKTLEAKIEALTSIEQSLKERGQVE